MKYVIASALAFALCIAAGLAVTRRISAKKELKLIYKMLITAAVSISLIAVGFFAYLEVYYHADRAAVKYLKSSSGVKVEEHRSMYFFDGPGSGTAVIFYPGGKVEETAYAPLMHRLAEQGTDCFLLKLPFRMAVFAPDAPDDIIEKYDYDSWYLMGHSLGGIVASEYNAKNSGDTDGVILLASYPNKPVPGSERDAQHIRHEGRLPQQRGVPFLQGILAGHLVGEDTPRRQPQRLCILRTAEGGRKGGYKRV